MKTESKNGLVRLPTVALKATDRAQFLASSYFEDGNGGVFAPGLADLAPGEHVLLRIDFTSPKRSFELYGAVKWRRTHGTASLPVGCGIEIAKESSAAREFLLEFCRGRDLQIAERSSPRLPVRLAVRYQTARALLEDWTSDISRGGLALTAPSTDDLPGVGTPIRLAIALPGRIFATRLRGIVAWNHIGVPARFGIRLEFKDDKEKERYQSRVDDLRTLVESATHRPVGKL